MIRKLKPLKQILAENRDDYCVALLYIRNAGCELEGVDAYPTYPNGFICKNGNYYSEEFLEPVKKKEKVQYYQVMYRNVDGDLFVCNQLVKSKEQFEKKFKALKVIQLIPCGEPVDE
jgi:hypothetical protein